ncbi:MAG TPA: 1-acyl-sn-glycerol-3-phosphate acyltransferase [Gemmata sp.]|nr:1-acyl-sn-glycerol-3-phosphate acyltransferase [Gemmata sp.]
MSESDSPQVRRDRVSALVVMALLCAALPTLMLLVNGTRIVTADREQAIFWFAGSAAVGLFAMLLFWAPYRAMGFTPYAAMAWVSGALYGVIAGYWPGWLHGLLVGVMIGALFRGRRGADPREELVALIVAVIAGGGLAAVFLADAFPFEWAGFAILLSAAFLCVFTWVRLFRPLFELSCEPPLWLLYSIRGRGPGLAGFPRTGPCIVIANHASWFDPLFLAKVLPRPITPMMTARFYDLPFMRRLMPVFGVIRVPEQAMKKDTPEIQQAIEALDRGECVVIFPEGYLRRTDERALRRFGQGIWQILQARPETPVFACWIEGGWGSYASYYNGPPAKNKKLDFRRRIAIGVSESVTVPRDVLLDHLPTRIHLMNLVGAARGHTGNPALPPFESQAKAGAVAHDRAENGVE